MLIKVLTRFPPIITILIASILHLKGAQTTWTFSNSTAPLDADSGAASLRFYDPNSTDWGTTFTTFATASELSLPLIEGSDTGVMAFPACTFEQGYKVTHGFSPNGNFQSSDLTSDYTLVMDLLFPSSSDGEWRALLQTNPANTDDSDLYIQNQLSAGFGISNQYDGAIIPNTWHRVTWVIRTADNEGQAHRFIDGQFVGAIGTTGSGLDSRWALQQECLLFTDNNGSTAPGFTSSISIIDRALSHAEVTALGRPSAAGTATPGPAALVDQNFMSRPVQTLGHRGASGHAPENTLAAIDLAFQNGAAGTEIDIRVTSDDVIIAFHDSTVDRTTDGSGSVSDMTLAEIKELDAGSWFSSDFIGEKIPTLEEVLTTAKGQGVILLDIKDLTIPPASFLTALTNSDFPTNDLWFWVRESRDAAIGIRQFLPEARLVWGDPDSDWQTNPSFFSELRDLGVIGFSFQHASASLEFSNRAKAEGMFVEVYTLLTPAQIRTAAANGVDYMETDFPDTMLALQPAQGPAASGPQPVDGSSMPANPQILTWVPGRDALAHRINFGTTNPPEFIIEQTSDLFKTPVPEPGTTYYWSIDTVTATETVTGPIWSFTTQPTGDLTVHEWHLQNDLTATLGDALLSFAADTESQVTFGTSDGTTIPHMANGPSTHLQIPAFENFTRGLDLTFLTTSASDGQDRINQYSFVFDIFVLGTLDWLPFFNTGPANTDDGDFFARPSGAIGIGAIGYSSGTSIESGVWQRIIYSADLTNGEITYYVNGVRVFSRDGSTLIDGRFSLQDAFTAAPHVRLFNDNNGETTALLLGNLAFVEQAITADRAAELGSPDSQGIFSLPPAPILTIHQSFSTNTMVLSWDAPTARSYTMERSADLENWTTHAMNISGVNGTATTEVPITDSENGAIFYRVFTQ